MLRILGPGSLGGFTKSVPEASREGFSRRTAADFFLLPENIDFFLRCFDPEESVLETLLLLLPEDFLLFDELDLRDFFNSTSLSYLR